MIEHINLHLVKLPLKEAFSGHFGSFNCRESILVEIIGDGITGWGEAAVLPIPYYSSETIKTVQRTLNNFLIPIFFKELPGNPFELKFVLDKVNGNPFAKSSLESAFWDWNAKKAGMPLYKFIGGKKSKVEAGAVISYKDNDTLLKKIDAAVLKHYHRIKIKIGPGHDIDLVKLIRMEYPELPLAVDANAAYSLADLDLFKKLDQFNLLFIEEPLKNAGLSDYSKLQSEINTPICLDESIENAESAKISVELGSCKMINIKPGRVGGISESIAIHDLCYKNGIPVWCGGMLETGVGRAVNIALSTLPGFSIPGDISEPLSYLSEDIINPPIVLNTDGTIDLSEEAGIGYGVAL